MAEMEDKNMDEAKMIWRLSNGELVAIEDKVQITTSDDEVGSSLEEMEQLESDGYEIEDVTDEYTF